MDSKLVVEQMSGRWKIKHPDMKPLAAEANAAGAVRHDVHLGPARAELARRPAGQRGPRRQAQRRHRGGRRAGRRAADDASPAASRRPRPRRTLAAWGWRPAGPGRPRWCWSGTASRRTPRPRSSRAASRAPTRASATRAAPRSAPRPSWLAPIAEGIDAVVASPVRRTLESAEIIAEALGRTVDVEPGLRGDGVRRLGRADLRRGGRARPGRPRRLARLARRRRRRAASRSARSRSGCWPGSTRHPRGAPRQDRRGGQPRDARSRPWSPRALDAPLEAVFRMELSPASVTRAVASSPRWTGRRGPRCGSTTPGRRATTRSRRPPRPGDASPAASTALRVPLALVHGDHPRDRDLVTLGDQVGGQRLR